MTKSQMTLFSSVCRSLGLSPSLTGDLVKSLNHWCLHHGEEWAVNRLKQLRAAYLQFVEGKPYGLPGVKCLPLSKNTDTPIPKGPWGKLFERGKTPVVARSLRVLHAYTLFKLTRVSKQQKHKLFEGILCEREALFHKRSDILNQASRLSKMVRRKDRRTAVPSTTIRAEWFSTLSKSKRIKFQKDFPSFIANAITRTVIWEQDQDVTRYLPEPHPQDPIYRLANDIDLVGEPAPCVVGRVGLTQERGAKLRAFASPNLVYQCILEPLKRDLFRALTHIPSDCTYDQRKGVEWVSTQFQMGRRVWSVDLSNATDIFPYEAISKPLLSMFADRPYESLVFDQLARGAWDVSALIGKPGNITWVRGQPLGLSPSFALFALSHHAVALAAATVSERNAFDVYRIVGDDIVISCEATYKRYRELLVDINVSISEQKTLESSASVAEFCGHTIFADGHVLPSTKWLHDIKPSNATVWSDVFRHRPFGLTPKWKAVYKTWYTTFRTNAFGVPYDTRLSFAAEYFNDVYFKKQLREEKLELVSASAEYYTQLELNPHAVKPAEQVGSVSVDPVARSMTLPLTVTVPRAVSLRQHIPVPRELYLSTDMVKPNAFALRTNGELKAWWNCHKEDLEQLMDREAVTPVD